MWVGGGVRACMHVGGGVRACMWVGGDGREGEKGGGGGGSRVLGGKPFTLLYPKPLRTTMTKPKSH